MKCRMHNYIRIAPIADSVVTSCRGACYSASACVQLAQRSRVSARLLEPTLDINYQSGYPLWMGLKMHTIDRKSSLLASQW